MARGLTPEQRTEYLENGHLLVEDVIPPEDLQPLIQDITDRIGEKARDAFQAGQLDDLYEDEPFERRLGKICNAMEDYSDIWKTVMHKNLKSPGMFAVITNPGILDIVESLIGPEILAHPQWNLQAKLPCERMSAVPWHQDKAFLQPNAKDTFMVNVWTPLVDVTVENGCLEVMTGSHKSELKPHGEVHKEQTPGIRDEDLPHGEAVACPVRRGGVVLFQGLTMHRSFANRSDGLRWSLDLRYSDPAEPTGRDHTPGFIARSRKHPESVARSHRDWIDLVEKSEA